MSEIIQILVIDDNPSLRQTTVRLLQKAGYKVVEASTGNSGLHLAREHRPDLILLAATLPDIDSLELCRQIKTDVALAAAFVVLIYNKLSKTPSHAGQAQKVKLPPKKSRTPKILDAPLRQMAEPGADEYISRPASNREFLAQMQAILRIKQAEETLRRQTQILNQRGKHLSCLYSLSALIDRHDHLALTEILQDAIDLLPPTWQYPDLTCARITLESQEFKTSNFRQTTWRQAADIMVWGEPKGNLEVYYLAEEPAYVVEPFLKEERDLLNAVAGRLGKVIERIWTEKARHESEQKFHSVIEQSADGIVLIDKQGLIVEWNRGQEQITGLARAEVLGRPLWDAQFQTSLPEQQQAPGAYERIKHNIQTFLETREESWSGQLMEGNIQRSDGTRRVIQAMIFPIKMGEEMMAGSITRDITERRQAEETMWDREKKYRQLVELAQEGIWAIDAESNTTFVNPWMAKMLGYQIEEMLGRSLFTFMDEQGIALAQIDVERRKQGIKERHDFEFIRKDGRRIYTTLATSPIANDEGIYEGALALVTDITERKEAEMALQQAEHRYRRLFEEAPVMYVITYHRDGIPIIINCNECFLNTLGYSRTEVLERPLVDFYPPAFQAELSEDGNYQHDLTGDFKGEERELLTGMGKIIKVLASATPIFDAAGQVAGAHITYSDISELKQLQQRLAAVHWLSQELALLHDEAAIIYRVLETAAEVLPFEAAACGLIDNQTGELNYPYLLYPDVLEPVSAPSERPESFTGQSIGLAVLHSGQPLNLPDLAHEAGYIPLWPGYFDRSELCAPIKIDTHLMGVLEAASNRPYRFTPADQQLLQTLADQTAVALESARLHRAVQRQARELVTLNKATQAMASSLALNTVLEQVMVEIRELLEAEAISVLLSEPERQELVFATVAGPGAERLVGERVPLNVGIAGWVARERQAVLIEEAQIDPRFYDQVDRLTGLNTHSLLAVPLIIDEQIIGVIEAMNPAQGAFQAHDLYLLEALAGSAAIAIQNARLFEQVEQEVIERKQAEAEIQRLTENLEQRVTDRTRELSALYDITTVASEALDTQTMLERSLEQVLSAIKENSAGSIHLLDETGQTLRLVVQQGLPADLVAFITTMPVGVGFAGWVMEHCEPLVVPDIAADPRAATTGKLDIHLTYAGAPMRARGQVLGVLAVLGQTGLSVDEVVLLTSIADQVGVAVENIRLRRQAEQTAVLEERARLARELHDSISQSLYSLALFAEAGWKWTEAGEWESAKYNFRRIVETSQQMLKEMRLLVYELRPLDLQRERLVGALHRRLKAVEGRVNIQARLVAEELLELPAQVEEELYRMAQEALNNALKHAAATSVTIYLRLVDEWVELEIVDDGIGFDPITGVDSGGMGLQSIRERAERLGGSLVILSAPEQGTRVKVRVRSQGNSLPVL